MTLNSGDSFPFIYSPGTQIVVLKPVPGKKQNVIHPLGAVGVITKSPQDQNHSYRVRFTDGYEAALNHSDLVTLAEYKKRGMDLDEHGLKQNNLFDRVIFRCIIGSRAYGLEDENSDTDRRGIYLPPAELNWSLYGVPEQIENEPTQECYWELQKFLVLALKANPNVLECLYSPLIEKTTPIAEELLEIRSVFLSKLIFQTYNGYVMSQFKKMQGDIRNHGKVKWKHVMHLIRILYSGIEVLERGFLSVRVDDHREQLLAIKRGEVPWEKTEQWRLELHEQFQKAAQKTNLPERPDYERANSFLVKARHAATEEKLP